MSELKLVLQGPLELCVVRYRAPQHNLQQANFSKKGQYVSDFHLMYGVGMGDRENPAELLVERVVGEGHEAGA